MKHAFLFLSLCVIVLGCSKPLESTSTSSCSIECKKQKALLGDVSAAENVASSLHMPKSYFWIGIAAQNGSTDQAYAYALVLTINGTPNECYRALYWARRAASSGNREAGRLVTRLEDQREKTSFSCGCAEPPPGNLPVKPTVCPVEAEPEKYLP